MVQTRVVPRIDALSHAGRMGGLRVSRQVVKELFVGGAKQPLAGGPEAGLCRWPCLLRDLAARQQRFEVDAFELPAAIRKHQNLR